MGDHWTLQDAKNKFSALVEAAKNGEPQHVTRRGEEAVVILSAEDYRRLTEIEERHRPKLSFIEHLLNAPKLPEGFDDIFDDRDDYPSFAREFDFDE